MQILQDLLATLDACEVLDVRIGLHWTAVLVQAAGERRCGLAATLSAGRSHGSKRQVAIPPAGDLTSYSGSELARWALLQDAPTQASVGMAALNALLPRKPGSWVQANAEEVIALRGAGKRVTLVGHFPFVERLRPRVGELLVLEQSPSPGDLPAEAAPEVLPSSEVVAITGMTLINHTLEGLLALCPASALVIVLGPSTPLSPALFAFGVDIISGAIVEEIESTLRTVSQGGNFRQVHRAGVRLVNLLRPGLVL